MTPCAMQKKCGAWDLNVTEPPHAEREHAARRRAQQAGISAPSTGPTGRRGNDVKGADESKSTLTSEAGKCVIGKENRSFST